MRYVLVFAACLSAGCLGNPASPDAVVGKPFELKIGATATFGNGTRLRFDAVRADSRCPIDANCIRAGEATIAISVARPGAAFEARELRTDAPASQISYADYVIRLTELQPYPRSDRPATPGDYVATFIVEVP